VGILIIFLHENVPCTDPARIPIGSNGIHLLVSVPPERV
jgi:hypothetical protein